MRNGLLRAASWLSIDAIASRGMLLLTMFLLARLLGADNFGKLTAIQATVTMASAFLGDTFRVIAARDVATTNDPREQGRLIGVVCCATLIIAATLALLLTLGSGWIADRLLHAAPLQSSLQIAAWVLIGDCMAGTLQGVLTALGGVRLMAACSVAGGVALLTAAWFVAPSFGLQGVLAALALVGLLTTLLRLIAVAHLLRRVGSRMSLRFSGADVSRIHRIGLPSVLNSLTWAPVNWFGSMMLLRQADGFSQLALIGVANQWFAAMLFIPNVVAGALLPSFARDARTTSEAHDNHSLRLGVGTNLALVTPIALLVACFPEPILRLYGTEYAHGAVTLAWFAVAAVAASTLGVFTNFLMVNDRAWQVLGSGLIWAIVYMLLCTLLLAGNWGATALAVSLAVGYAAKLLAQVYSTWQLQRQTEQAA